LLGIVVGMRVQGVRPTTVKLLLLIFRGKLAAFARMVPVLLPNLAKVVGFHEIYLVEVL